jgi:hypothetical protein
MLNDAYRHTVYDAAITAAVKAATTRLGRKPVVLDIGAGTGLLGMMAARAGAAHVYCVEGNMPLAKLARAIIEQNGLSQQVTVLAKMSNQVRIGDDMPVKADVLISEIIDSAIIGEDIMPTYEHALAHLITRSCIILPDRATLTAVVVESSQLRQRSSILQAQEFAGFDFSALASANNPDYEMGEKLMEGTRVLTEPFELTSYDFSKPLTKPRHKVLNLPVLKGGSADAVVFWFDFWVDRIRKISAKHNGSMHWTYVYRPMRNRVLVEAGDTPSLVVAESPNNVWYDKVHCKGDVLTCTFCIAGSLTVCHPQCGRAPSDQYVSGCVTRMTVLIGSSG